MSLRLPNKDELRERVLTVEKMTVKPFDWSLVFEKKQPLVLDAGCGKGEFLLKKALENPHLNYIGVDYSWKKCLFSQKKIDFHQIKNAMIIRAPFEELFPDFFANEIFEIIHMNFPDPWPKKRHNRRRSLTNDLVNQYVRMLKPDGLFYFVTDSFDYAKAAFPIIENNRNLKNQNQDWVVHEMPDYLDTLFCQKAKEKNVQINYLKFKKNI